MKHLLEVIAKALVDQPDKVTVTEKETADAVVLELHVAEGDMGKVIGKQEGLQRRSELLSRLRLTKVTRRLSLIFNRRLKAHRKVYRRCIKLWAFCYV